MANKPPKGKYRPLDASPVTINHTSVPKGKYRPAGSAPTPRTVTPPTKMPWDNGGGITGFGERFVRGAKRAAVNSPGGIYAVGKALSHDTAAAAGHIPGASDYAKTRAKEGFQTPGIAKGMGRQIYEDFKHPGRDPFATLMDVLALASAGGGVAARVSAAGRAGSSAGALKALAVRPASKIRYVKVPDRQDVVHGSFSRNASVRQVQKGADYFREKHPTTRGILTPKTQMERRGDAIRRTQQRMADIEKSHSTALQRMIGTHTVAGRRTFTEPMHKAVHVVGEQIPIDARIAFHRHELSKMAQGTPEYARTQQEIGLLHAAKKYVVGTKPGRVAIRPAFPDLKRVAQQSQKVARRREKILKSVGVLGPGSAARLNAPGQVMLEHWAERLRTAAENAQHGLKEDFNATFQEGKSFGLTDAEIAQVADVSHIPEFKGGKFRIPYKQERGGSINMALGSGNRIGVTKLPSTVNHPFTAAILKQGGGRTDVARLIAESHVEAQRFAQTRSARLYFLKNSALTPEGIPQGKAVAIRLEAYKNHLTNPRVNEILRAQANDGVRLSGEEEALIAAAENKWAADVFEKPSRHELLSKEPITDARGRVTHRWVHEDELGGLNKPHFMASAQAYKAVRGTLTAADVINNAERDAILYLKPAYGPANFLGNTALTMAQQGFAAPKNLWNAAHLVKNLGFEDGALIDEVVGNGITAALKNQQGFQGGRAVQNATQWLGGKWQKVIDQPFRRASFLYEAGKQGFKTQKEIHDLLHNPRNADKLHQVTDLANKELIDYGNLGPIEREILRRGIFFYPWVKGATVYTGRFVMEHPIQLAVQAQLGLIGAEDQRRGIGLKPGWAEALIKTSGVGNIIKTVNPASGAVLQTPWDLFASLSGSGQEGLAQQFTPALQAAQTYFTGYDGLGRKVKGNRLKAAFQQLYVGLPAYRLGDQLTNDQSSKTFPVSKQQALFVWLIGTMFVPRNTNVYKLNKGGYAEAHPR